MIKYNKKMRYPISDEKISSRLEYYSEAIELLNESTEYLKSHVWCKKVIRSWLFINLGKVLCIFLYEIENSQSAEDNLTWVMVGDFPPVYLDTINVNNTQEVVDVYIELVEDWIESAEAGQSLEECFPLLANWSDESIEMLKERTKLLRNSILPGLPKMSVEEIYAE